MCKRRGAVMYINESYVRENIREPGIHLSRLKEKLKDNGFGYEEYAKENTSVDNQLLGSSGLFFMVAGDQRVPSAETSAIISSDYIRPLVSELTTNPHSSYKTIYNDLIIEDGYTPKYFSSIVKDCHGEYFGILAEIAGSRLANLMGIPTNYAFGIEYTDGKEHPDYDKKPKKYFALGSIDYVSQGHELELFCDIDRISQISEKDNLTSDDKDYEIRHCGIHRAREKTPLSYWIKYIDSTLETRYPEGVDETSYKKLIRDFIKTYIFRVVILRDQDFACYNCGILSEEGSNKFEIMPCTDMEGVLYDCKFDYVKSIENGYKSRIRKVVDFCRETYPEILDEFMSTLSELKDNGKFENTLSEVFPKDDKNNKQLYTNINNDIDYLLRYYRNPSRSVFAYLRDTLSHNMEM